MSVDQPSAVSNWARDRIAALERAWERYWPLIQTLDEQQLEQRLPEGRTIKQNLAHVAFWEEASGAYVLGAIRGEKPRVEDWYGGTSLGFEEGDPWPDADTHNAREAAWADTVQSSLVLGRLERARSNLIELLATVTDDEGRGEIGDYLNAENLGHYEEHLSDIHRWTRSTNPDADPNN